MKVRSIKWKGSRRDTYAARRELWMALPVIGARDSTTFWSKKWRIK